MSTDQCGSGLFEKLLEYDGNIENWGTRAKRGALRATLGFATEAIDDLEVAKGASEGKGGYWIEAQLGEAVRIYARDVIVTTPPRSRELRSFLSRAIAHFNRALDGLNPSGSALAGGDPEVVEAWIHAHLGACKTLEYWGSTSAGDKDADSAVIFEEAMAEFGKALKLEDYPWAKVMRAFLLTLRGEHHAAAGTPSDFMVAAGHLKSVRERAIKSHSTEGRQSKGHPLGSRRDTAQSSFERNLAMLYAYEAAALTDKTAAVQAAKCSVEFGLEAVTKDPSDFLAAYFVAASLGWLVAHAPGGRNVYGPHLDAAIHSARVRCKSAVSLATVSLAGLAILDGDDDLAGSIMRHFDPSDSHIDIETAAILRFDPVFRQRPAHHRPLCLLRDRLRGR